jgi:hypothetical protein
MLFSTQPLLFLTEKLNMDGLVYRKMKPSDLVTARSTPHFVLPIESLYLQLK